MDQCRARQLWARWIESALILVVVVENPHVCHLHTSRSNNSGHIHPNTHNKSSEMDEFGRSITLFVLCLCTCSQSGCCMLSLVDKLVYVCV
jgi:hypothetical protein